MHVQPTTLKPLASVSLSAEEGKILAWIRSAKWETPPDAREPLRIAKVPEFYSGARLYSMQGNTSSQGPLELLLKKLQYQGVIGKLDAYPLQGHGGARHLTLRKADLDNLFHPLDEEDE